MFVVQQSELDKATVSMWSTFEESCGDTGSCLIEQAPISATTHLNYFNMKGTEQYDNVKAACQSLGTADEPAVLCHVNSELDVTNGATGENLVTDKFFSRREPVCFPFQCGQNQVSLAHKTPLGCDPDTAGCNIIEMEAECPTRKEGAGSGNCNKYSDNFAKDEALTDAVINLNSVVGMECLDYKNDGSNEVCASTTEPIALTAAMNFRAFETEEVYRKFQDACFDAEGEMCYISLTAKIEGEIVFFNIDLSGDYNDYPMCFPLACDLEDREEVAKETVGKDIAHKVSVAMKSGARRLSEKLGRELDEEFTVKALQTNDEEYCPVRGMDKCQVLVSDFYCYKRVDDQIFPVDGAYLKSTTGSSSASTLTAAAGSVAVAVAMAGGVLL